MSPSDWISDYLYYTNSSGGGSGGTNPSPYPGGGIIPGPGGTYNTNPSSSTSSLFGIKSCYGIEGEEITLVPWIEYLYQYFTPLYLFLGMFQQ